MTIYRLSNLAVNINLKIAFDSKLSLATKGRNLTSERFLPFIFFMESLVKSSRKTPAQVAGKTNPFLSNGFNSANQSFTISEGLKTQPETYFNNTRINEGKSKPVFKVKSKRKKKLSERLNSYYQTRTRLSRLYDELGNAKKAGKIFKCCSFVILKTCGDHVLGRAVNYRCFDRLCPECSNKRSNRLFYEYQPIIDEFLLTYGSFLRPIHLVLTQAQKIGETIGESHRRIKKAFKKLTDRKFWKESFVGSLNSFEFTISSRTFADGAIHFHAHILAFCKLPDKKRNKTWLRAFKREWLAVSDGENKNLKVIPVTDLKNSLREILKYQVKPQSIDNFTVERLAEIEELRHSRMTFASGEFHSFVKAYRKEQKSASDNVIKLPQTAHRSPSIGEPCSVCEKPLYGLPMPVKASIIFIRDVEIRQELSGNSPPV